MADQHKINYKEHNPFDISAAGFVPIYKGSECVSQPLAFYNVKDRYFVID